MAKTINIGKRTVIVYQTSSRERFKRGRSESRRATMNVFNLYPFGVLVIRSK